MSEKTENLPSYNTNKIYVWNIQPSFHKYVLKLRDLDVLLPVLTVNINIKLTVYKPP